VCVIAAIEQAERLGGAGLLGVPAFDAFVWLLDTYARGDLLISLHERLPSVLPNPSIGFLCMCAGLGLLYMSHKRNVASLRRSGRRIVDSGGVEYQKTGPRWVRPVVIVFIVALVAAPLLAVAYSLAYKGNPPDIPTSKLLTSLVKTSRLEIVQTLSDAYIASHPERISAKHLPA
jgi:hypothetical protein